MEAILRHARLGLATLFVGLLPGTLYLWGELYLSGYTRRPDGSRDFAHMEKLLGGDAVAILVIFFGLTSIGAGLATFAIARAFGRVTALRLTLIAAAVGSLIPLVLSAPSMLASGLSVHLAGQLAGPILAAIGTACVLSAVFSLVAGLPFRGASPTHQSEKRCSRRDIAIVAVATGATIVAIAWLSDLLAWGVAHPCHSCG